MAFLKSQGADNSDKIARRFVLSAHLMRIRSPSLPELHAFVTAARLSSFVKAGQALEVTAGAISRSVARAEQHLELQLLRRHSRGCALTAVGQAYFDAVAPAIDALEAAAMQTRNVQEACVLKLSVTPTLATHWLIRRLPDFFRQHPEVKLSFVPYQREALPLVASQGVSIRGGDGLVPPGMEADYVTGRLIVAVCRPGEQAPAQAPCELLTKPLLCHTLQPGTLANWFQGVGCPSDGLQPVASFEQVSQLLEAAVAGLGVAVVQRCLIDDYLLSGRLVLAHPRHVVNDRGYHLCYPQALRRSAALTCLRQWLQDQGREAAPS